MEEREVELIDYQSVLGRRKWLILAGTLAAALAAFAASVAVPRAYEATVTLLVTESKIPRPEGGEGAARPGIPAETFESMLRSQSLALQAIQRFGLDKEPFAVTPAGFLADIIRIRTLRGINLITLTAILPDPKLAADVANFMAQKALELNARLNQTDTLSTKEYIQQQLDEARKTMDDRQAALVEFKRTANLEGLRMEQKILLNAKQTLAQLYSDYTISLQGLQTAVADLRRALANQEQLLTVTKSIFQDPSMLAAAQERGATDLKSLSSIQLKSQEINAVYQSVQGDLIFKEATLVSLESQRQDVERKIKDNENRLMSVERKIADSEARLEELTRNYTLAKEAYELFAKKFDEASLSVASRITELKIVDPAIIPGAPRSRKVILNVVLASAAALMAFIMLAFFLEYSQQIKRRRDKVTGIASS